METLDEAAGVITKDGAACVLVAKAFFSSPSGKATTNR
jgi:hypothetical protein